MSKVINGYNLDKLLVKNISDSNTLSNKEWHEYIATNTPLAYVSYGNEYLKTEIVNDKVKERKKDEL